MNKERQNSGAAGGEQGPGWIATILIALIAAGGALYVYDARYAQRIKCVDPAPYIKAQWELVAEKKISKKEFEMRLDRLDKVLDLQSPNTVVVLKDVVVRNAEEIKIPAWGAPLPPALLRAAVRAVDSRQSGSDGDALGEASDLLADRSRWRRAAGR